jgi:opacity protein-like surface antigen
MKKLGFFPIMSTLLLLSAGSVMADDTSPSAYNGLSASLYGGYGVGYSTQKINYFTAPGVLDNNPQVMDSSAKGGLIGLGFGLGRVCAQTNIYYGAEIFGDLSNITGKYESEADNEVWELKKRRTIGIAAKLGKVAGNTLFYAKLGVLSSKWQLNTVSKSAPAYSTANKNLRAFTAGLGVETLVSQNTSLGAEVMHSWYNTFKHQHHNNHIVELKPRSAEAKVFISFKF